MNSDPGWLQEYTVTFLSLAVVNGFTSGDIPGIGTLYDFFHRLYFMDKKKSKAKGKQDFEEHQKKRVNQAATAKMLLENWQIDFLGSLINP